jgi:indole-3-glycerol phosphate synthase
MATYLDEIVSQHREEAGRRPVTRSLAAQASAAGPTRGFARALAAGAARDGVALIAEVKRRSPSKGNLAVDLDPASIASAYERGGASCLSVLTEGPHFGGEPEDLRRAHAACSLPVLRKDFTVCETDVYEARIMGADAVLLIVAALDDSELEGLHGLATSLGLDALVEIHDEAELDRARRAGAGLIGVNQRDLHTFSVDHERARRVGALIPPGTLRVAESGISSPEDVALLVEAGYEAILVGEALVTSGDPAAAVRRLLAGAHPGAGVAD